MTSEQNRETPGFFPDCQKWPHAEVDCRGDNAEDHDPSRPVRIPTPIQERIDAIQDRIDAMYDQPDPSTVPGFAKRERGAADAWESFAALNGSITPDFRAGYHRGVIDQARRQPASEAHAPTECADCGRSDGGCDRIMDAPTKCPECRRRGGMHKLDCGQRHPSYHHYMMVEDTPASVSEPGKTDIPSAQASLSGRIPTDDEREALIALKLVFFSKQMEDGYPSTVIRDNEEAADIVIAAGFHRTMQGETMCEHGSTLSELCDYAGRYASGETDDPEPGHAKPQSEPTDAVVEAARAVLEDHLRGHVGAVTVRAALKAAAAVQGGETR